MIPTERRDDGFTLVEMLVSVAILGILMSALVASFMAVVGNKNATMARITGSHNAQLANAYFADDVAAAGHWTVDTADPLQPLVPAKSIELGKASTDGSYPCGTASTPLGLVRMVWDDYTTDPSTTVVVSYGVRHPSGSRVGALVRTECGGTAKETVVADDVVWAATPAATAPKVSCFRYTGAPLDCTATDVGRVDLRLTIATPQDPTPFTVTLSGQRRQA